MKELSPSVPHCRDVTEQPTVAKATHARVRILSVFTRGLFVGGCVVDPILQVFDVFWIFWVFLDPWPMAHAALRPMATWVRYAQLFPFGVNL